MKIKENYKYSISINHWAIIEFLKDKYDINQIKDLKIEHYYLLSGIIHFYLLEGLKHLKVERDMYTLMADNLFFNNLPFLSCGLRTLKERVSLLEKYGFISRYIENQNKRYIRVNRKLLHLLNKGDLDISPVTYLKKYFTKEFNGIYKKYVGMLPYKRIDKLIKSFDDKEHLSQYMSDSYNIPSDELLNRLELYLDKCVNDPYHQKAS